MNYYRFSWCVCSFDQECIILSKNESNAINIFIKNIVQKDNPEVKYVGYNWKRPEGDLTKTWAASYATITNLNEIYTEKYLLTHYKANFIDE